MPSWLTKAKAAFKPTEPKPAEPYRLVCVCGESLEGMRGEREQRLTCRYCEYEMFVLPVSVYPLPDLPLSPLRRQPARPQRPQSSSSAEPLPAGPADEIKIQPKPQPAPETEQRAGGVASQTIDIDHLRGIRDRRPAAWKLFTPFRGLLCGILVVILLTGYAVLHSRNLERAQMVLVGEEKAGRAALENRDLILALEHFGNVNSALETLGSNDAKSRELRQLYWELKAANGLIPNPLHEMIAEAVRTSDRESASDWEELFEFAYEGKWVILEAPLPENLSTEEIRIPIPVILPGESAVISVGGDKFAQSHLSGSSEQLIIAGQVESCLPEGTEGRMWVIRLKARTAFLWSNVQTYQLLGFLPDDKTADILAEQAGLTGEAP